MAGRKAGLAKAWSAIRGPGKLELDDPTDLGPYLGCDQSRSTITRDEAAERLKNIYPLLGSGEPSAQKATNSATGDVKLIRYDMEPFHRQCVGKYKEIAKANGIEHVQLKMILFSEH